MIGYQRAFSDKAIEEIKRRREEKQKKIKEDGGTEHIHTFESKNWGSANLWAGDCGENGFVIYLSRVLGLERKKDRNELNINSFLYPAFPDNVDDWDVEIPFWSGVFKDKIDVKTAVSEYDPAENYYCPVVERNYKKMMKLDNEINCLVFCNFNIKTNKNTLLGWLTKDEFKDKAIYRKVGTVDQNGFTSPDSNYAVLASQLHWFDKIFPDTKITKEDEQMIDYLIVEGR